MVPLEEGTFGRFAGMGDYHKLTTWQSAKELVILSHPLIKLLPPDERFALADQWRRATYSVILNIAEGASRYGPKEFRRFLDIARASLHEVETVFEVVLALGYLSHEQLKPAVEKRDQCARMVFGLLRRMSANSTP